MGICKICGKQTTSHIVGKYFICHTCWENRKDEVEKLRKEIREEFEKPLRELEDSEEGGIKLIGLIQKFSLKFDDEIKKSLKEYGKKIEDENEFTVFLNWFAFERNMDDGTTPAELFMNEYEMPEWVRERIKKLHRPVKGFFEVKENLPDDRFKLRNIFDDKEYILFGRMELKKGDFIGDEIYPWDDTYLTGGAISLYTSEEAEKIMGLIKEYERLSEETRKLQQGIYKDFVDYFGRWDPVFSSVDEAKKALEEFTAWWGQEGRESPPERIYEGGAALACHPVGGIYVIPDYGRFIRILDGKEEWDGDYMKESFLGIPSPVLKKLSEDKEKFAEMAGKAFGRDVSPDKIDEFMEEMRPDWNEDTPPVSSEDNKAQ